MLQSGKHFPYNSKHVNLSLRSISEKLLRGLHRKSMLLFARIASQNARGFVLQRNICAILRPFEKTLDSKLNPGQHQGLILVADLFFSISLLSGLVCFNLVYKLLSSSLLLLH